MSTSNKLLKLKRERGTSKTDPMSQKRQRKKLKLKTAKNTTNDEKNKKNFDDNAKRTSLQTKLMSLMNEKDKIYHKIKQLDQLQKK